MLRVSVFVDGFNVYHALDEKPQYHKYKWLDYRALAQCYVGGRETLTEVYCFTALATWNPDKVKKHRLYLRALEKQGVRIVMGKFKRKDRRCRVCRKDYRTFEEKLTDVNIAIHLFRGAYLDEYDKAILITGDSDILPAVEAVRDIFPTKPVGVVIPIGRRAEELKQACDSHFKMKERHLAKSQLPEMVDGGALGDLNRPTSWR